MEAAWFKDRPLKAEACYKLFTWTWDKSLEINPEPNLFTIAKMNLTGVTGNAVIQGSLSKHFRGVNLDHFRLLVGIVASITGVLGITPHVAGFTVERFLPTMSQGEDVHMECGRGPGRWVVAVVAIRAKIAGMQIRLEMAGTAGGRGPFKGLVLVAGLAFEVPVLAF